MLGDKAAGISALLMCMPLAAALIVSRKYYTGKRKRFPVAPPPIAKRHLPHTAACAPDILTGEKCFRPSIYQKQNALGLNPCKLTDIALSVFIPLVYLALSYGMFWLFAKGSFTGSLSALTAYAQSYGQNGLPDHITVIIVLIAAIPGAFLTAFGEEVGWRGWMYPAMQKLWGWKKALIVSGLVWAVWHLPLIIGGVYLPGTNLLFAVPLFTAEIFALTVIVSWLRMKSNSVWPAAVFHAAHNYFDQVLFQSFTQGDNSAYFTGETGVLTVAATALIAAVILIKEYKAYEKMFDRR
jgi:membrane protease YdiL (CAAX protease family)